MQSAFAVGRVLSPSVETCTALLYAGVGAKDEVGTAKENEVASGSNSIALTKGVTGSISDAHTTLAEGDIDNALVDDNDVSNTGGATTTGTILGISTGAW